MKKTIIGSVAVALAIMAARTPYGKLTGDHAHKWPWEPSISEKLCRGMNEIIVREGGQPRYEQIIAAAVKADRRNCEQLRLDLPLPNCGGFAAVVIAYRKACL